MIEARAPGKLVITGEYAILQGAPAIAMAVDVQACVRITAANGPSSALIESSSGERFPFEFSPGRRLTWTGQQPGQRGAIVQAVFDALLQSVRTIPALPGINIELDTDGFFRETDNGRCKIGLGSSAALLVALVGAAAKSLKMHISEDELRQVAFRAHTDFQGVRGSGVDVLTALSGGVIAAFPVVADRDAGPRKEALSWPERLEILPVWSGSSASTPDLLKRFFAYRDRSQVQFGLYMSKLAEISEQSVSAWRESNVAKILATATLYAETLQALDVHAGIGIDTDSHRDIRKLISRRGACYKTSGAGGGDFGLVMTDSIDLIESIKAELIAQGKFVLEAPIVARGLVITQRENGA